jgi:ATP-dependent RNA helicase DDX5/DBP2
MGDKSEKEVRKAAMKKEAEELGITYEELKKRQKKKKREAEALDTQEHKTEVKRLRAYSKDVDSEAAALLGEKKRRTRSMDKAEEDEATTKESKALTPLEWRKENEIKLEGHGGNRGMTEFKDPYIEFADSPFSPRILQSFKAAGFARPSAIQAQAWPLAIEGKDLISVAKTGSGKTCGFLLPVFHHHEVNAAQRGPGQTKPMLLVLAPTRELSVQIQEEAQKFGRPLGIRSVCCFGGASKYPQIAALQRGVECIIATPGRLNDLIEMRKADLSTIQFLVLDEADRMLDMVRNNDSIAYRVFIFCLFIYCL